MDPAVDCQADRALRHATGAPFPKFAMLRCKHRFYPCEDTVCIQTCKFGIPGETVCPIYEQSRQAIEFLCGSGLFSIATVLDRFRRRAQDHSYTNKLPGPASTR
jgi:hypothetical protein